MFVLLWDCCVGFYYVDEVMCVCCDEDCCVLVQFDVYFVWFDFFDDQYGILFMLIVIVICVVVVIDVYLGFGVFVLVGLFYCDYLQVQEVMMWLLCDDDLLYVWCFYEDVLYCCIDGLMVRCVVGWCECGWIVYLVVMLVGGDMNSVVVKVVVVDVYVSQVMLFEFYMCVVFCEFEMIWWFECDVMFV